MFLKQAKYKNGKVFLSIVEGYYDPTTKSPKQRTVEKLGYLSDLQLKYPDPVAHFKAYAKKLTEEQQAQNAALALQIDPQEKLAAGQNDRKNLGYAVLSQLYHQLHLDRFINNHARHKNFHYNANTLFKNAVYSRILFPGSKKADYAHRELFFEKTDYTLADVYRNLDFLAELENSCQVFLNHQIRQNYGRQTELVYYDVTNYYFEIDEATELQRKGVSKEHRPDPIVQLGLLMDQEGIPISYRLYPGNTSDCLTYRPFIKQAKVDLGLGRIIVVADKAMNTGNNIWYTLSAKNGYVFSQSIRGTSQALKEYVLDQDGYQQVGRNFKIKSRLEPRSITITLKSGKKQKRQVDEKQVVFYSEKYARRARYERAKALEKARKIIARPSLYDRTTAVGASGYVKNLQFDKKTGEIIQPAQQLKLDEQKIAAEEKLDGYYMLLTSEIQRSDQEIMEMYRGLWRIEESFKITKTDLQARPVFVRRENRIRVHFLTCFVALTILRLLQKQLDYNYSATQLTTSLRQCEGVRFEKNLYVFSYFSPALAAISHQFGLPLDKKYLTQKEIKKILANTK